MKNTSVDISVKPLARDQLYIMTTANCAFEVFVQNAAYAKMLFGTFPIMRVNVYYRQMIDKQELAGAVYQHMCGCCRKKRTICIYDTALGNFACLVCRANVARPWYDFDAKQYIGYDTENRYNFFLDCNIGTGKQHCLMKLHYIAILNSLIGHFLRVNTWGSTLHLLPHGLING